ncbi:MAG TPA: ATP-dependent Clp protease proteolytic subunit [Candidatus Corynebacterium faecigallinarum]|uniref:ATP-dependent Clp protease proteolytic subunit n=1 Tax=Candidatus Corynebacterium faecigallinarum TaxID=2838528 RepID=A0A9D2TNU2_9CORY|nr:ATP-dependent Clp protease proteolytic subunit [Candidatus Corynebacterium faecigallinarum]
MTSYTIPYVTTATPTGEKTVDIYSRLLDERIIYLGTPVDDRVSNAVIAQLLHLESDNPEAPVSLYVNSPGGSQSATMAIYDCMQFIRPRIETTCVGQAVASSAILLAGGTPGHRSILRNGRVVLTAPATEGGRGTIPDLIIEAEEMERIRRLQEAVLTSHCGRAEDQVRTDTERQLVLAPDAAVDYGIVDRVLTRREAPGS